MVCPEIDVLRSVCSSRLEAAESENPLRSRQLHTIRMQLEETQKHNVFPILYI